MNRAFSLLILAATLIGSFNLEAAPTLSLSTSSIQSDANGTITHTITGIAPGETVTIERFADLNNNGAIDSGEPSFRTFMVTDGLRPTIGGVVNGNVPGDDSAANGSIRVDLPFPGVDVILGRQPGKYIVRVTGPSGQATAPFEVTSPNLPQNITGVLKNSSDNSTISFGIIVILVGDGNPIGSVRTDSTGAFNIVQPAGQYALLPISDGFSAPIQMATLPAGQTVTQNLTLTPSPARISGKLTDASTGAVLPGVFVIAQNNTAQPPEITGALTDLNGDYGFNVTAGSWQIRPQEEFTSMIGYVVPDKGTTITAGSTAMTVNLTAIKANALIYGHVTDSSNNAIQGLAMKGRGGSTGNMRNQGRTSATGDYFLGATDGLWEADTDGASLLGFQEAVRNFTLSAATATRSDIVLSGFTAHVRGRVTDGSGNGIANAFIDGHFNNSNDTSSSATTQADGSYDLPVWGGSWTLHLGNNFSGVDHTVSFTVVDGVDQTINFVVPNPIGQISGVVKNNSGQGVSGIFINAQATINGVPYQSGGTTDATGHFSLPVINGDWSLWLSCGDLQNQNYDCPQTQFTTINNNNATVNFTVQAFVTTASLNGKVVDATGATLSGIQVEAYIQNTSVFRNADSQADGTFSIPVYAGQWTVQANNLPSNLIGSSQQFTVTDGVNINSIKVRLLSATSQLSGTVKTSAGTPVAGIHVYANATINNASYYLPYAITDAAGTFAFQVAPGAWNVNLDCGDLNGQNFNCANGQTVTVSSTPGTANFTVTAQGPSSPTISAPQLFQNGGAPLFQFSLTGNPGTYDIQGSPTIPFSPTAPIVNTVTITPGSLSVFVSFAPGANQFFRVVAR